MTPVSTEQITALVSTRFLNGRSVSADEDLLLTGQIDSLGIVALISHLEEMRGAPIPPQDVTLENFATIAAIASYLNDA